MTYIVNVIREGRQWLADVEGLPGAHTYAGNLLELDRNVQEVIALVNDEPEGADTVPVEFVFTGDDLISDAHELGKERTDAALRHHRLMVDTTSMVQQLVAHGYSVRDIAGALDMTPGRVSQIAKGGIKGMQAAS